MSGTPTAPGVREFKITVPEGAAGLNGSLSFSPARSGVRLRLIDPSGEIVDAGRKDADGNIVVVAAGPPASGGWAYRVSSTADASVEFQLTAVVELRVPADRVVARTVDVAPGGCYEVNVIMEANATFRFAFNATAPIAWDVHSHPLGGVKFWHEGADTSNAREFTAPTRGVCSLFLKNKGESDAQVGFDMRGAFRMHSQTR